MNIIIITDALTAPLYTIRVRFLNRQLLAEGHTVTWYTEKYQNIPEDIRPENLIEIPYYTNSKIDHIVKGTLSVLTNHKNRFFARHILLKVTEANTVPDIVFCSTFHTFGLRAGLTVAKHFNCPLHIDLRDIAEQTPTNAYSRAFLSGNALYRRIAIRRRNAILRQATTLTSVSNFHRDFLSHINPNTHVIYNGYDRDIFYPSDKHSGSVPTPSQNTTILYTGRWYGERMQDPHPLFRALSGHHDIKLLFYTGEDVHGRLRELATQYDLNLELHSYVPNSQVPDLLRKADIALVLTSSENRGVLTTKFFEALGTQTPVLCSPSDNGELAELIRSTKSGIASADSTDILDFIYHTPKISAECAEIYSRQYQTGELIKLITVK